MCEAWEWREPTSCYSRSSTGEWWCCDEWQRRVGFRGHTYATHQLIVKMWECRAFDLLSACIPSNMGSHVWGRCHYCVVLAQHCWRASVHVLFNKWSRYVPLWRILLLLHCETLLMTSLLVFICFFMQVKKLLLHLSKQFTLRHSSICAFLFNNQSGTLS